MQRLLSIPAPRRTASQPPGHGLRLSLAQGAAAALAALVLVWQAPPAAAADSGASASVSASASSAPASASAPADAAPQFPQGTWSGIREGDAETTTPVTLTLNGNQEGKVRLERRRCALGLKPLQSQATQISYLIGPLKNGAPGMAPACDRFWDHLLVLAPDAKSGFHAQIQDAKRKAVLEVDLSPASSR